MTSAQTNSYSLTHILTKHIVKTKRNEEEAINTSKKEVKNNLQKEWKKKTTQQQRDSDSNTNWLDNIFSAVSSWVSVSVNDEK